MDFTINDQVLANSPVIHIVLYLRNGYVLNTQNELLWCRTPVCERRCASCSWYDNTRTFLCLSRFHDKNPEKSEAEEDY